MGVQGYRHTEEAKAKIRAAMLGRRNALGATRTPEHKSIIASIRRTHGRQPRRLYTTWKGMRQRVNDPNAYGYPWYGGKGVEICAEWADFAAFRDWALENGYTEGLSIDRIDSDGHYEPGNCRWVTRSENSREAVLRASAP